MSVVPAKRMAARAVVQGDDLDDGQVTAIVIILQYHSGSTAPLLVTVGGWKIEPVNVANTYCSSASHCSIIAQALVARLVPPLQFGLQLSGVTSAGPISMATSAHPGKGVSFWGMTIPFLTIPGITTRSVAMFQTSKFPLELSVPSRALSASSCGSSFEPIIMVQASQTDRATTRCPVGI